jgi:hypothetical protein
MLALSIREPWVGKILRGEKTIDLRTWKTRYRGPLLLCASARPVSDLSGRAVCVVDLVDVRTATDADSVAACHPISARHMAWVLANVRAVSPMLIKGRLGLFRVDIETLL